MVFHIDTDRRTQITPWVTYALIAVNFLVFMFIDVPRSPGLYLWSHQPEVLQFFTYQFLHSDTMHILGNMLFLWVFGNHVEERFGHAGYLFFYLASGVLAGAAHALPVDAPPVIGASGAVAGVTGAFLALYPMTTVEIDVVFLGEFEVSSIVLILFRIATDAAFSLFGGTGVAYTAHLAGYLFGFVVAMSLLVVRFVPREDQDMLGLIERQRRGAPDPAAIEKRRTAITDALIGHDPATAARLYQDLLAHDPEQVLPLDPQLEVANQFMREQRYTLAARAYELLLARFPDYGDRAQVQLVLGLVYARHLSNAARARELLQAARPHLDRAEQERVDAALEKIPA